MDLFFSLFLRIIPLYALIALGYFAGKKLNAKKETVAPILIYIIAPFVIFNSIVTMEIKPGLLLLPVIFFIICSLMCLIFYFIGGRLFKDSTRNILAFTAGSANTGYFGIPVAIELFGEEFLGIVVLCILGFTLYENSLGYFIVAKGNHTIKEAFYKLLKLPTIYAFFIAVFINFADIKLSKCLICFGGNFVGAYSVLGMMLIGLGLADMKSYRFDLKFLASTFISKFIAWPLITLLVIFTDNSWLHLFNFDVYKIMILISIVPLAANTVAFATDLKAQPEKASLAVFLSTLFGLFYIPLIAKFLLD